MLAATLTDISKIQFPVLVSPKLDGIRCIVKDGKVLSRKLKLIPNKFIREQILREAGDLNLDGEILVDGDFNNVQSAVMSEDGEPNFRYFIFDTINKDTAYNRLSIIKKIYNTKLLNAVGAADKNPHRILFLQHNLAHNVEDILRYEEACIKGGYEGVMLRHPEGKYKFGRSTEKEGGLIKLKRFHDAEAVVIGFEEKMHNGNEASKDELGRTKRSSKKEGLVPTGTLGAIVVRYTNNDTDVEFSIGTGYDDEQRREIWAKRSKIHGHIVTFKYQELSKYGIPRFPVFKCFRKD